MGQRKMVLFEVVLIAKRWAHGRRRIRLFGDAAGKTRWVVMVRQLVVDGKLDQGLSTRRVQAGRDRCD